MGKKWNWKHPGNIWWSSSVISFVQWSLRHFHQFLQQYWDSFCSPNASSSATQFLHSQHLRYSQVRKMTSLKISYLFDFQDIVPKSSCLNVRCSGFTKNRQWRVWFFCIRILGFRGNLLTVNCLIIFALQEIKTYRYLFNENENAS